MTYAKLPAERVREASRKAVEFLQELPESKREERWKELERITSIGSLAFAALSANGGDGVIAVSLEDFAQIAMYYVRDEAQDE